MKVNSRPLAGAGRVNDGVPLVDAWRYVVPELAAVKTTVAPTSAVVTTLLALGPVMVPVTAKAPVMVVAPATARVEPSTTGLLELMPPASCTSLNIVSINSAMENPF